MRIGFGLLLLLFALMGAVFGALNSDKILIDFYSFSLDVPKGAALLSTLLTGWIVGGLAVYLGWVVRLQRQLRVLRRERRANIAQPVAVTEPVTSPPPSGT